jgi:plastocyanin
MKKLLLLSALLPLMGAGCWLFGSTQVKAPPVVTPPVATPPPVTPPAPAAAITVTAQTPGLTATVHSVTLAKASYVVIHEDNNGAPGTIIGQSVLLQPGTYTDVNVTVTTKLEAGKTYYAMIHTDNGDGVYATADDVPAKDASGNVVMVSFMVTADVNVNVQVSVSDVAIKNNAFTPTTVTVKKGAKIVWTNMDSVAHNVVSDTGVFTSQSLQKGEAYTLDTANLATGTYAYHCSIHPTMTGTVIVQ